VTENRDRQWRILAIVLTGSFMAARATEIYADAADLLGKIPASAIGQLAEHTGV
jgi:hypothetical protein